MTLKMMKEQQLLRQFEKINFLKFFPTIRLSMLLFGKNYLLMLPIGYRPEVAPILDNDTWDELVPVT
jgi:hypothetical protein